MSDKHDSHSVKETIIFLTLIDGIHPLAKAKVGVPGAGDGETDDNGGIEIVIENPDDRWGVQPLIVTPAGKPKSTHGEAIQVEYVTGRTTKKTINLETVRKQREDITKGKVKKPETMGEWTGVEWRKFFSYLLPVLAIIGLLGFGAFWYTRNETTVQLHFANLRTSGPEVLGGLSTVIIVVFVLNLFGALLRGERGLLEDAWAPVGVVALVIGWKPWMAKQLQFVMDNMQSAAPAVIFNEGMKAGAPLLVAAGFLAFAMLRAVTFQRMEKRLDFSPANSTFIVLLAVGYYKVLGFSLPIPWQIGLMAAFVAGCVWEGLKKPWATLAGIALGIFVALMGSLNATLVSFSIAGVVVLVFGIWQFVRFFDRDHLSLEFSKLMEKVPFEILEFGWDAAFITTVLLARFGATS